MTRHLKSIIELEQLSSIHLSTILGQLEEYLDEDLRKILVIVREALVRNQETFAVKVRDELEAINTSFDKLKESSTAVSQLTADCSKSVSEMSAAGLDKMRKLDEEGKSHLEALDRDFEHMVTQMAAQMEYAEGMRKRLRHELVALEDSKVAACTSSANAIESRVTQSEMDLKCKMDEMHNINAEGLGKVVAVHNLITLKSNEDQINVGLLEECLQETARRTQSQSKEVSANNISGGLMLKKLIEEAVEKLNCCHERQTEVASEQQKHLKGVNSMVSRFVADFNGFSEASQDDVRTFCAVELETYIPTGQTPLRKSYQYPRSLVQTSPHERLLKRFQIDPNTSLNASDMINEEVENDCEDNKDGITTEEDVHDVQVPAGEIQLNDKHSFGDVGSNDRSSENNENKDPNIKKKNSCEGGKLSNILSAGGKTMNRQMIDLQRGSVYVVSSDDVSE